MKQHGTQAYNHLLLGRCFKAEHGSIAIEFAIIFPVFILLMMGLFELALITWGNGVINNVVTRAAQMSTVGCVDNDVEIPDGQSAGDCVSAPITSEALQALIADKSVGFVKPEKLCLSATTLDEIAGGAGYRPGGALNLGQAEDIVVFYARYNWDVLFPFMRNVFGNTVDFESIVMVRNDKFLPYSNANRNQPALSGCTG